VNIYTTNSLSSTLATLKKKSKAFECIFLFLISIRSLAFFSIVCPHAAASVCTFHAIEHKANETVLAFHTLTFHRPFRRFRFSQAAQARPKARTLLLPLPVFRQVTSARRLVDHVLRTQAGDRRGGDAFGGALLRVTPLKLAGASDAERSEQTHHRRQTTLPVHTDLSAQTAVKTPTRKLQIVYQALLLLQTQKSKQLSSRSCHLTLRISYQRLATDGQQSKQGD